MKINRTTAIVLGLALATLLGLAGWGQHLHMDPEILTGIRTVAAAVFSIALAVCGPILRRDDDHDGIPDVIQRLLGLAFAAVVLVGCGANVPQVAASGQATVLVATQPARVAFYEAEAERCYGVSEDFPAWERCMLPAEGVQRAADAYRDSLHAAQAAIRLGQGADMIPCVAAMAGGLVSALEAAGAPVPAEVREVAALAASVGESCHAE